LQAQLAEIALVVDVPSQLPLLRVHADHVEEVVVNLLDNALKYTPAHGTVKLTARVTGAKMNIYVEDDGPGIPAEDLPYIFDRFYRVDKVRSRRRGSQNAVGSGAGLGLSIVRQLVEQNGGQIGVEPAPEQGTIFVVSFPAVA
jgi:signal transduction histidine kinase